MSAPGAKRKRPVFTVAAETIAAVSGVAETVVDFVHGRALRHYQEGLRQYAALRAGDVEAANRILLDLRAKVVASTSEELLRPPGVRARLYRAVREFVPVPAGEAERRALPFRPSRATTLDDPAAIQAIRFDLPAEIGELLELRYARELSLEEAAFVLGLSPEEATAAETEAKRFVRDRLGAAAEGEKLAGLLVSAFALERSADDAGALEENPPLPPGTVLGGRYSLLGRVGSGAFGDVYSAQDTEVPGHRVALKLLHQAALSDAARSAGLRELHLIASVFHPSVVQFKDHGWYEGRLWFVMPWYDGETLESRLQRHPLTRKEARRIFEPLARALATMHAAGIRHQDVKPDNIMLARIQGFGQRGGDAEEVLPVLLDLGVAAKDAEMVIAGTPNYFAPEVAAQFASVTDKKPVTPAADVFSLALALRNALEPETQEDVPAGAVERFIERRAQTLPGMPKRRELRYLEPYFRRWMNLDPALRPSADELAEELEVLTRPEVSRARRMALLRWAVPLALAVGVVFLSVVYVLNERAERQKIEAARARLTASGLREDLNLSREQRKNLERDVESIRERYEHGQLSRQQLAEQIAKTEGQLKVTRTRLSAAETSAAELQTKLTETSERLRMSQSEVDTLRTDLTRSQTLLAAEQERSSEANEELSRLRVELAAAQRNLELERRRVGDLDTQVALLRSQLSVEQGKVARLEREASVRNVEAARTPRPRGTESTEPVRPRPDPVPASSDGP